MTTTPGLNDLTTVAAVQAFLTDLPTSDANLIQSLVSNASAFIQTYTSRSFISGTYTEVRDGNGRDSIALFNGPVSSVTSVTVDNQTIPASPGWPQPGYSVDETCVWLRNYCFRRGRGNVTIVYTAGYASIPGDLAQACIELVVFKYKLRDKTGTVTEGMAQQTTSYSQKDMPASVKTVLDSYRRYF
jgi:hypothetical protein